MSLSPHFIARYLFIVTLTLPKWLKTACISQTQLNSSINLSMDPFSTFAYRILEMFFKDQIAGLFVYGQLLFQSFNSFQYILPGSKTPLNLQDLRRILTRTSCEGLQETYKVAYKTVYKTSCQDSYQYVLPRFFPDFTRITNSLVPVQKENK